MSPQANRPPKPEAADFASPPALPGRGRWYQFRLRTLLAVVLLVAILLGVWRAIVEPYRLQLAAQETIERLGGSYVARTNWLNRLRVSDIPDLTLVNLADCDKPDEYIEQVAALPHLETLLVGGSRFTDSHLRQLRSAPRLRGLVLDSTEVTDEGVAALAAARPGLTVYRTDRRLLRDPPWPSGGQPIVVKAARGEVPAHLSERIPAEFLVQAKSARLRHAAAIDYAGRLHALEVVQLEFSLASKDYAPFEQMCRRLAHLERLHCETPLMTDDRLARLDFLPQLTHLALDRAAITDAGLASLGRLSNLRWLSLWRTAVTDEGLVHLEGLDNLAFLDLGRTGVTAAGVARLRETLPGCLIWNDALKPYCPNGPEPFER